MAKGGSELAERFGLPEHVRLRAGGEQSPPFLLVPGLHIHHQQEVAGAVFHLHNSVDGIRHRSDPRCAGMTATQTDRERTVAL